MLFEWAGKINMKLDNFVKAKNYFQKQIELKDKITSGDYTFLAEACLKSGKLKEALGFYDTAIKMDPKNISAIKGKEYTNQLLTNIFFTSYFTGWNLYWLFIWTNQNRSDKNKSGIRFSLKLI